MASRSVYSFGLAIASFLLCSLQTVIAAPRDASIATHDVVRRGDGLSAESIIRKSIKALGGQSTLENVKTISSHASIYRTFSLAESNMPGVADTGITAAGMQTISYDLSDPSSVVQRIDRKDVLGDYWTFQRTQLEVPQSSLVVRSGPKGYACFTAGNVFLFAPPEVPFGYTDPFLADVLVRDAWRFSPALVLSLQASQGKLTTSTVDINDGQAHPSITDSSTNLTVMFDPETYLPCRVRANENHPIFGRSTSDVMMYNYTNVDGMSLAQNVKLLYNNDLMLQEIIFDKFQINPKLSSDYFDGLPYAIVNETFSASPPIPAEHLPELFNPAEIFEFSQNFIYAGPYNGSLDALKVVKPVPSLANLYHLTFTTADVYRTLVAVFDDAIMVTDAPPGQSKLVIEWVKKKFGRDVTHLLVTHHHHDHNLGAPDYVDIGAKLVVPEAFEYYWQNIPGVEFESASEAYPFLHADSNMQVRGVWHNVNAHSADWMYFTFTEACPQSDSPMGVVTADAFSPGVDPHGYGQRPVLQWLAIARGDGVAKDHIELPIHGEPTPAIELYPQIGYEYPNYTTTDFVPGGPWC